MPETPIKEAATAARGVATETFPDHVVLRPPNRLMERATRKVGLRDTSDAEAIERAENALEVLSSEFDAWMQDELETLEQARAAYADRRDEAAKEALYRSAHDLRGQAATFGFPLAGEIADGLCQMLEDDETVAQSYLDRHAEAIRAIVRENARDRDHLVGSELVARLVQMRAEILKPKSQT